VRLGLVSDLHLTLDPARRASWHNEYDFAGLPGRIDAARASFERVGVDAVIACGDLTHAGDEASTRAVLERLSGGSGPPVLLVAGNHDMRERDDQLERCLTGSCELLAGRSLESDGVRVTGVPVERDPDSGTLRWTGGADPVSNGSLTVVASHFPVLSRARRFAEAGLRYPRGLANRAELSDRLSGTAPVVVLCGHLHGRESHASGNVLQLCTGALVEAPYEAAIVDVTDSAGAVRVRRHAESLGPPPAGPDPVLAPAEESWIFDDETWRARPPATPRQPPRAPPPDPPRRGTPPGRR
jgi:predicted phosphodiesterase